MSTRRFDGRVGSWWTRMSQDRLGSGMDNRNTLDVTAAQSPGVESRIMTIRTLVLISTALLCGVPLAAQQASTPAPQMPAEYAAVLQAVGRQGDYKDNVLKVNIPRS